MKKGRQSRIRHIIIVLLICASFALLLPRYSAVRADMERRREASIKEAVLRSAFQCYAVEGVYPVDLGYLEKGYGLLIDHDRYIVSYECYASNRPPEVMVLKR